MRVYEDTGSLTYGTTTVRDLNAASWLLQQQAVMDTVRQFSIACIECRTANLLQLLLKKDGNARSSRVWRFD